MAGARHLSGHLPASQQAKAKNREETSMIEGGSFKQDQITFCNEEKT